MATSHGADFSTQAYRHGVKVGNWNEDQYGCDLMASSIASAASFPQTLLATSGGGRLFATPLTTTHTSYTDGPGHAVLRDSVHAEKAQARMAPDVSAGLLFAHRGSAPIDERYQSTYGAAFTAGTGRSLPPPVDKTIAKWREIDSHASAEPNAATRENQSRQRSYRTASSDAYSAASSLSALPVAGAQSRGAGRSTTSAALSPLTGQPVAPAATGSRVGQCATTLEANYRKIGLRSDK